MRRLSIALISLTFAAAAAAEPERLSSQKLHETVPGSVIELDTPIGTKIPMRFGTDGLVSGEAGILGTFLGSAKDRGRWWVERDRLCIEWFRWFDSEPRCMEIRAEGSRIFWQRLDGDSGTATLTQRAKPKEAPRPPVVAAAETPPAAPAVAVETSPAKELPAAQFAAAATSGTVATEVARAAEAVPAAAVTATPNDSPPSQPVAEPVTEPVAAPTVAPKPALRAADAASKPKKPGNAPATVGAAKPPARIPVSFRVARVEPDDLLNVRSGPSEYHKAVGIIPPHGRGVEIVGACVDIWCPIRHGTVTGWVNRYYLAKDASAR